MAINLSASQNKNVPDINNLLQTNAKMYRCTVVFASFFCLLSLLMRGDGYEEISRSELLPELDLSLLAQYVLMSDPLQATLGFRERIRELADRR